MKLCGKSWGLAVSLFTRQTPKETVSQVQETPQGQQTPTENQESGLASTQIALTALPTATAAGGILPKPTATASPRASATVAASALTGRITDPREVEVKKQ